jgi:hypothetical protein
MYSTGKRGRIERRQECTVQEKEAGLKEGKNAQYCTGKRGRIERRQEAKERKHIEKKEE